nr:GTP cyclohydrolase I [Amycolatopsis saalfeldensis]
MYRHILIALGEDPDRAGLRDTPRRAAAAWAEFLTPDPARRNTSFAIDPPTGDGFVLIQGISTTSAAGYGPQEMSNAATVVAVGKRMNVPE